MTTITLKTRDGSVHEFEGREGRSLMENIRDAGFEELVAMCGGCMSCATCHVYIDNVPADVKLPPMSVDEDELLDGSDYRQPSSRLSCQVPLVAALRGIAVTIAPED
ncbi:2Fe-2S iron-sulfur cluster-binding protein [Microvirga zambiensis]|uniref:2Fe-2S iron-sulfur cluster-binding protein n=1 Tax=Microvirga zambiensis TaxID=1402137 RepID=UPI00191FCCBE|nr:2Fe-2S iron-sulfur cluster-binding protein [Microvirga zambiensis]